MPAAFRRREQAWIIQILLNYPDGRMTAEKDRALWLGDMKTWLNICPK
jgi:hypothetical protein